MSETDGTYCGDWADKRAGAYVDTPILIPHPGGHEGHLPQGGTQQPRGEGRGAIQKMRPLVADSKRSSPAGRQQPAGTAGGMKRTGEQRALVGKSKP